MLSKSYADGRAGTAIQVRLTSICYEFGDRPQRNGQPTGPVPRLVTRLINRLVQLVRRQNQRRITWVDAGCRRITVTESSSVALHPLSSTRGQLLVCLVDGTLIGSILTLFGLNFAPLIGLFVVILTMIPYIGIVICWVPAVLIAAFQWGDWTHPLIVTIIFIVVQNLEGMFYAPRIVGKSVGLHPMTVIVSIFVWGLLIGGLLGPILAVPLTATIKVLLTRYVWGPRVRERVREQVGSVPVVREAEQT